MEPPQRPSRTLKNTLEPLGCRLRPKHSWGARGVCVKKETPDPGVQVACPSLPPSYSFNFPVYSAGLWFFHVVPLPSASQV